MNTGAVKGGLLKKTNIRYLIPIQCQCSNRENLRTLQLGTLFLISFFSAFLLSYPYFKPFESIKTEKY